MANVRCPMCSKVNALDARVCAFCGARLKPLSADETASQTPANNPEDEAPDWLSGLRGGDPAAPPGEAESSGAEANQDADLPDWLSRIRGRARTESGGEEIGSGFGDADFGGSEPDNLASGGLEEAFGTQEESQGGLPDWLNQQPGEAAQQPASQSGASDDDWLSRLQDTGSGSFGSEPAQDFSSLPDFSSSSNQDANLDWLNQPSSGEQAETAAPFDLGGAADQPAADDWMSTFSSWNADAPQETAQPPVEPAAPSNELSGFGLTGFLSNLEGEQGQKPPEPPAAETGSGGFGLTGFLNSLEGEPEQTSEPEQQDSSSGLGLTSFFSTLESSEEQPSTAPSGGEDWSTPAAGAATSGAAEEALPDWLSSAEPAQDRPEPEIPTGSTGDLSSWLSSLEGEQPQGSDAFDQAGASDSVPASTEGPAEQIPDWLSAAGQESTSSAPQQAQPEESLPGWLSETPSIETPPAETANLGAEMPSWFADLQQPAAGSTSEEASFAEEAAFTEEAPKAEAPAEISAASTMPAPFIDEDTPAWLRDFGAEGAAETSAEAAGISPLLEDQHPQMQADAEQPFAVELPDWLEEDAARAGMAEETVETGASSQDLERVELPSWVAAMRPVESAMPGGEAVQDTDQFVEKAGPLSGMRGVLPIPENLLRYRKPPIYSVKLHTTEKQRNQSALLDSIIAQESQPLLIPPARSHAPLLIMRIVIALLLVGVIALPNLMQMLGMPFESLSTPALQPVELEEMYNQINQGAQPGENYTVLLAFDYEPGFSGEMTAAASPVISHLMQQNAQLVVVSTSPNGPALADRLLHEVAQDSALGYVVENRSVNLGYLPGGTISLLEFVREPRFAAPVTVTGESAWEETFLSGVNGFADFSQVIVLTDSAETGRSWIEQVSPQMGDVPLFMVASAQAAPMLIPFLNATNETDSGQIDGMVAGMMGGAQYGWFAGQQDTLASGYWASYQLGIVLAIVLVLAGGLISGIRRMLTRDDKGEA